MVDEARRETDKQLAALERRIARIYREARDELQETVTAYFERFREQDEKKKAAMEAGEITRAQYYAWRKTTMLRGRRWEALRDKMAERMTKANEVAAAYVNDTTPGIYSLNRNYTAFGLEKNHGNLDFTLFDEQTVRRLIVENPDLLPDYPAERAINRKLDLAWGKKQISRTVTSSILQGRSVPNIAKDLMTRLPTMERDSAIRAARTAITSAENGGRQDSYKKAAEMGIKVRKRWIATKDGRTRDAHRKLDGQTVDWDESFSSSLGKIRFPGDPRAKPANTYNCRCSLRTVEKAGIEAEPRQMRVRDPKTGKNVLVNEMTYSEWEEWVKKRG